MHQNQTDLVYVVTDPISVKGLLSYPIKWFAGHCWNVGVICGREDPCLNDMYSVLVHFVDMKRTMSPLGDATALWRLIRALGELRPKIVNAGTPKAGLLGMLASWAAGVPVRVYTLYGLRLETTNGLMRAILTLTEKVACRCAHKVICVSDSLKREALRLGLTTPEKLVVLGAGSCFGVDASRFELTAERSKTAAQLRRNLNIPPDAPVIGFIGRLTRDKGIVELIEAFKAVSIKLSDARLLLVGPFEQDDPVPAHTRREIATNPFIHHVGWVASTTDYLHAMDLMALPTYREGFPNVALEAAAAEKPIVATRVTGVVDAVVDGVTGLLSPVGDPRMLAVNILRLLTQKELAKSMGRAARQRVEADFSIERVCAQFESFYLKLCHERGLSVSTRGSVQHETRFVGSKMLG